MVAHKREATAALCEAIHKGIVGADWENLYHKFAEMNKEVNVYRPCGSSRAKTMWKERDAKERCDAYRPQTSEQKVVDREAVRQELWNEHLLMSPAQALAEPLRRVEVWNRGGFCCSVCCLPSRTGCNKVMDDLCRHLVVRACLNLSSHLVFGR